MSPVKTEAYSVFDLGRSDLDIGPCDAPTCTERARTKVQIVIGEVQVLAYVCDRHKRELFK